MKLLTSHTMHPSRFAPRSVTSVTPHQSEKGIALVITLIMLSVTLVMAVAFLALSQRERKAVSTTTDTTTARLAADTALNSAQAQIVAAIYATNSAALNFNLLVSTNYQNSVGFTPGLAPSPTNVNYDYLSLPPFYTPLNAGNMADNIANLQIFPRPPVYVNGDFRFYLDFNRNGKFDPSAPNQADIDFWNVTNGPVFGMGDPQWVGILERPDMLHSPNNKFVSRYAFLAVPVGNTLDINYINNAAKNPNTKSSFNLSGADFNRNQGVGSWEINLGSFLTDLNTNIYAWDFTHYTTNYSPIGGFEYGGPGFQDAASIYAYRLNGNVLNSTYGVGSLPSVNNIFGPFTGNIFGNDYVDQYSDGPLQLNTSLPTDNDLADANFPWPGAPSTNQFSDLTADLFDANKVGTAFTNRLGLATSGNGINNPTNYDRYTLYRLLSQLGTDSEPDSYKMNLNFSNVFIGYSPLTGLATNIALVPDAETNLMPWRPLDFFTAAANRLLLNYSANWFANSPSNYLQTYYGLVGYNADYYHYNPAGIFVTNDVTGFGLTNLALNLIPGKGAWLRMTNQIPVFGVTNIPVYVNGQFVYSSAVNRALQLAANLYDASTNKTLWLGKDFPSVFRPVFEHDDLGNIFIAGYQEISQVIGTNDLAFARPYDIQNPIDYANLINTNTSYLPMFVNIYNVPWIIGARKGFPNFNNFAEENILSVNRRVQLSRLTNSPTVTITGTNQLYMFGAYANVGLNLWNSYVSNYVGNIYGQTYVSLAMAVTNDVGLRQQLPLFETNSAIAVGNWPGSGTALALAGTPNSSSIWFNYWMPQFLTNVVYRTPTAPPATVGTSGIPIPGFLNTNAFAFFGVTQVFETNVYNLSVPHFGEAVTNHLQVFMISPNTNGIYQVIDYVHIGEHYTRDLNAEIFTDGNGTSGVWTTNNGVQNQIYISRGSTAIPAADGQWNADPQAAQLGGTTAEQQATFDYFFYPFGSSRIATINGKTKIISNPLDVVQTPYSPTRYVVHYTSLEANDPLVHYMASDMNRSVTNTTVFNGPTTIPSLTNLDLNGLNKNYNPWGGNPYEYNSGHSTTVSGAGNDTNRYSYWLKDPGTVNSDAWDFPTNKYPSVGWLGRVHRGTPWQTVYLKSFDVLNDFPNGTGPLIWRQWSGDPNLYDANNSAPVWDRQLFDLFTSAVNGDATRGTLSVNVGANIGTNNDFSLAAWSAVLSGVVVLTNVGTTSISNNWLAIQPAGLAGYSANSPLGVIVNSINSTRTQKFPQSVFTHVGDVLSAPALTQASPYLNLSTDTQLQKTINDETFEWLPQQIMGLLRLSHTPRYVVYGYGQTLRPAPDGLVMTAGANFGLVTNYQVVSESAVRAVISVRAQTNVVTTALGDGFETNYSTRVENYNVLPPQ